MVSDDLRRILSELQILAGAISIRLEALYGICTTSDFNKLCCDLCLPRLVVL